MSDWFADDSGTPNERMPTTTAVVTLTERGRGGTLMVIEAQFPSLQAMEQLVSMGMEQGMVAALGQIAEILAERTHKMTRQALSLRQTGAR
jgi:uncharacterized protein YndB with AHSA1/START domain